MTVVLAIETSCDETGVGIARLDAEGSVTLLADEVASSVDEHVRFGGVVPEIAARAHVDVLDGIVDAVRKYWEAGFTDIALVQIGDEGQDRFLTEGAEPLLAKLRDAAH